MTTTTQAQSIYRLCAQRVRTTRDFITNVFCLNLLAESAVEVEVSETHGRWLFADGSRICATPRNILVA